MTRWLAVPLTMLALTACADVQHPTAPETIDMNAQVMSDAVWFVTTPPNPAYVGATYQVVAEAIYSAPDLSSNESVCPLSDLTTSGMRTTATVTFLAVGTCRLEAWDRFGPYMIEYAEQVFEVVATTPARVPTPAPPRPSPPARPR